jgi:hypothetical protein
MRQTRHLSLRAARIKADPTLSRQFEGPLALLWGPASPGRPRAGLACSIRCCDNPGCSCRDVHVIAVEVDEQIEGLVSEGPGDLGIAGPSALEPGSAAAAELRLDLDTGEVALESEAGSPRVLEEFRAQVDANLLEYFHRRWALARGRTDDWRARDWSHVALGSMVAWEEAFPEAADVPLQVDGKRLFVFEEHCIEPACDCDEARVAFLELPWADDAESGPRSCTEIGAVVVSLAGASVARWLPAPGMERLLRRAWEAYEQFDDVHERLAGRDRRMKQIGPEIFEIAMLPPDRPGHAPNADDSCLCGSGRPYKRCCMLM